jgi:hypothetical protein
MFFPCLFLLRPTNSSIDQRAGKIVISTTDTLCEAARKKETNTFQNIPAPSYNLNLYMKQKVQIDYLGQFLQKTLCVCIRARFDPILSVHTDVSVRFLCSLSTLRGSFYVLTSLVCSCCKQVPRTLSSITAPLKPLNEAVLRALSHARIITSM